MNVLEWASHMEFSPLAEDFTCMQPGVRAAEMSELSRLPFDMSRI